MHDVVDEAYKLWKGKPTGNVDEKGKEILKPDTMLVQYRLHVDDDAIIGKRKRWAREWICIEHKGYAREKAERWWGDRSSEKCPDTIPEALAMIDAGCLANTLQVHIRPDRKFERITKYVVGEKPQSYNEESLPF